MAKVLGEENLKGYAPYSNKVLMLKGAPPKTVNDLLILKQNSDFISRNATGANPAEQEMHKYFADRIRLWLDTNAPEVANFDQKISDLLELRKGLGKVLTGISKEQTAYEEKLASALAKTEKANARTLAESEAQKQALLKDKSLFQTKEGKTYYSAQIPKSILGLKISGPLSYFPHKTFQEYFKSGSIIPTYSKLLKKITAYPAIQVGEK